MENDRQRSSRVNVEAGHCPLLSHTAKCKPFFVDSAHRTTATVGSATKAARLQVPCFHLYVDDSGSRYCDKPQANCHNGMDYFALGGVLVQEDDVGIIFEAHTDFMRRWSIGCPLHSTKIRGKRGGFSWLSLDDEKSDRFLGDLQRLILGLPIVAISCVIDRGGYVARYADKYPEPWLLCQTAFAILIERAAKFCQARDSTLLVYFEESGKKEDRLIVEYMRSLKSTGMPFPGSGAAGYDDLSPAEFRRIVVGEPRRVTKSVPMVQLADLVLYAMARGGYEADYAPFRSLRSSGKVIDSLLRPEDIPRLGVKYSCFDTKKARVSPSL